MAHAIEHPRPDGKRIAGYCIAIGFNALLLMLILVPMQGPPTLRPDEPAPQIIWYPLAQVRPPEVPVVPPEPEPQPPRVQPERSAVVQPPAPVVVDQGELAPPAVEPLDTAEIAPPTVAPPRTGPLPGVRLEYLQAPPPEYPRASARMRSEGIVLLQVLVGVDGRPLEVEIREGSGDRRLDAAAREQVLRHWRFRPAMQDGHAVQAIGLVPIEFKLR